jgi:hypothetical protein
MIDSFIKKIQDGELVYDSEKALSEKSLWTEIIWDGDKKKRGKTVAIIDELSFALADYQQHKVLVEKWGVTREHLSTLYTATHHAFLWINRAYMNGIIKEGPTLGKQLADCRQENDRLRREINELSSEKGLYSRISRTEYSRVEGEEGANP